MRGSRKPAIVAVAVAAALAIAACSSSSSSSSSTSASSSSSSSSAKVTLTWWNNGNTQPLLPFVPFRRGAEDLPVRQGGPQVHLAADSVLPFEQHHAVPAPGVSTAPSLIGVVVNRYRFASAITASFPPA